MNIFKTKAMRVINCILVIATTICFLFGYIRSCNNSKNLKEQQYYEENYAITNIKAIVIGKTNENGAIFLSVQIKNNGTVGLQKLYTTISVYDLNRSSISVITANIDTRNLTGNGITNGEFVTIKLNVKCSPNDKLYTTPYSKMTFDIKIESAYFDKQIIYQD